MHSSDFFEIRRELLMRHSEESSLNYIKKQDIDKTEQVQPINVYHIILDGFQSQLFLPVLEQTKLPLLEDFFFFENFLTNSWSTTWSNAILFRGTFYQTTDGAYAKWSNESYQEGFLSDLAKAGVVISQYNNFPFYGHSKAVYSTHIQEYKKNVSTTPVLVDLWFLNIIPTGIKSILNRYVAKSSVNYTAWSYGFSICNALFGTRSKVNPTHFPVFSLNMFEQMIEDEGKRQGVGNYIFAHIMIPHAPNLLGPGCDYIPEKYPEYSRKGLFSNYSCAVSLIDRLTQKLKELGRYNSSLIIIHADHGTLTPRGFQQYGVEEFANLEITTQDLKFDMFRDDPRIAPSSYIKAVTSGLLLIKYPDNQGNGSIREQAYQTVDIAPTILSNFKLPTVHLQGIPIAPFKDI
ncbi:MAG: sulfatase-like hydrolase/transferase, partial [Candidatus Heimdallarchaeota archaeon]|nr:sulfatase-like hydrolase/transferase [Candidatus Heimdallarchaeota archaeon]